MTLINYFQQGASHLPQTNDYIYHDLFRYQLWQGQDRVNTQAIGHIGNHAPFPPQDLAVVPSRCSILTPIPRLEWELAGLGLGRICAAHDWA